MISVSPLPASIPVFVAESLSTAEDVSKLSVRFGSSNLVWLVASRHVFIWNFKSQQTSMLCHQVALPPSGLTQKAELVSVVTTNTSNDRRVTPPSCVAVTPEGVVRFWPNVAHHNSYVESSVELQGQECCRLDHVEGIGYVLATTTCSLVLITVKKDPSQSTVKGGGKQLQFVQMKLSQGVVAGVSRRLSSLLWTPQNGVDAQKLVRVVISKDADSPEEADVYVLTNRSLQVWKIHAVGSYKLLWETELVKLFGDAMLSEIWQFRTMQSQAEYRPSLKVWMLDMIPCADGSLIFLTCGTNKAISQDVYYCLGKAYPERNIAQLEQFVMTGFKQRFQQSLEEQLTSFRLLAQFSRLNRVVVYFHDCSSAWMMADAFGESAAPVELQKVTLRQGDRILGAGCDQEICYFFGLTSGLLSVTCDLADQSVMDTSLIDPTVVSPPVIGEEQEILDLTHSEDKFDRFRAAFLWFLKKRFAEAQEILDSLSPRELDAMVNDMSISIIDDHPACDPRWAKSIPHNVSFSSSSLILLYQLEDKKKTHDFFISFLKTMSLWEKLSYSTAEDERVVPTTILLREHAEKIQVCVTLQGNPEISKSELVKEAMINVLQDETRNEPVSPDLSVVEVFLRKVSGVHQLLPALIKEESDELRRIARPEDKVTLVDEVNSIVSVMFKQVMQYRKSKGDLYRSGTVGSSVPFSQHYIPWTTSASMKLELLKQHSLTVEMISEIPNARWTGILTTQLSDMATFVLDDISTSVELSGVDFQDEIHQGLQHDRETLIGPLVQLKQFEKAATLAEKYEDFDVLIEVIDQTGDHTKLEKYTSQFANRGFNQRLYEWYIKHGKPGKLLTAPKGEFGDLSTFLHTRPDMQWLSYLRDGNYHDCSIALRRMGRAEQEFVTRQKNMLSIAKLAALAGDPDALIDDINRDLELIQYQESLPHSAVEASGVQDENLPPFSALDLIQMFIDDPDANELSFKKALDMLFLYLYPKLSDTEFTKIRLRIWTKAVLAFDWNSLNMDDPLEDAKRSVFFNTLKLVLADGDRVPEFSATVLPTARELLSADELEDLSKNPTFQYLVNAGFEHLQRLRLTDVEMGDH